MDQVQKPILFIHQPSSEIFRAYLYTKDFNPLARNTSEIRKHHNMTNDNDTSVARRQDFSNWPLNGALDVAKRLEFSTRCRQSFF
jgi:hypothetical protein